MVAIGSYYADAYVHIDGSYAALARRRISPKRNTRPVEYAIPEGA
jgi:hypothetical protein